MFFKFIFTDNERDMKGFTFNSGSRHDASNELEKFIGTYITQDKDEANYSAHLYIINMENEGEDEEALIDNLTNPEYQEHYKTWQLIEKDSYEESLLSFLEERSVFAALGL